MVKRLLALVLFAVAACTPAIEDGYFACADGVCPSGYVCHHDDRCYIDAQADYTVCDDDAQCANGVCSSDPLPDTVGTGLCAPSCASDAECPDVGGDSVCWLDHCRRACTVTNGSSDCPTPSQCVLVPGMTDQPKCLYVDDPVFDGNHACDSATDPMCDGPIMCRTSPTGGTAGLCAYPCGPNAECPGSSECRTIPGTQAPNQPAYICMAPCMMDQDCEAPLVCRAAASPPGAKYCVPPSWGTVPS